DSNIVKRVFYEDARGIHFFSSICKIDLEGMVAKKLSDPYHRLTKWYKVINPTYSQMVGRAEMFNKFRKKKTLN
ncbi:MAG: hypothetical protein JWO43_503, partial [Candidatus Adlerbacteria bacterium]|nr:hypothetical protein [Candidatus Adlerbacteria bacterium]